MSAKRSRLLVVSGVVLLGAGCSVSQTDQAVVLTADMPLHLEEHLSEATIEGCELPGDLPEAVEWRFDEPQPGWRPVGPNARAFQPVEIQRTDNALRLVLSEATRLPGGDRMGCISVDLPDWRLEDWSVIQIRARTEDEVAALRVGFNLRQAPVTTSQWQGPMSSYWGESVPMIHDGSAQTYFLPADLPWVEMEEPWRQLNIGVTSPGPASVDILSVSVVPAAALYSAEPFGVRTEVRQQRHRRVLYAHSPGRISYRVQVPERGRLDVGLGVVRDDAPVTFRVSARKDGGEVRQLHEESCTDNASWAQRSIDLSTLAGQTVTLTLESDADRDGPVALWAAPTISGVRQSALPNIVFYVIDGAGAEYLSLYGYGRRTTPNLEALAREGATFDRAYSNSSWTKISNPSFMTSLHNSVLGGYKSDADPLPDQAVTMAQHMHGAGYLTAALSTNAYCGTMSSLDRGVDFLRESGESELTSSQELQRDFWRWREDYPGEPYWVHFQTTDVHWPFDPPPPFAGLYISDQRRETFHEWERQLTLASGSSGPRWPTEYSTEAYEKAGISRRAFNEAWRDLYDEMMVHNDHQIGRLVARLKASGEWDNTLLIVAADHGSAHGSHLVAPGRRWRPYFDPFQTHIPLVFTWPGRITAGQRFADPVSLIDMLPTLLELAGLPPPEVAQGQSLAPLLLGHGSWEARPVIFDEFYFNSDGEIHGFLEMVDGRWGAELLVNVPVEVFEGHPERGAPGPLPLYDLWSDPYCLKSVHDEHPELVERYSTLLQERWQEHRELAKRFTRSNQNLLSSEQLRMLQRLGYIR